MLCRCFLPKARPEKEKDDSSPVISVVCRSFDKQNFSYISDENQTTKRTNLSMLEMLKSRNSESGLPFNDT